MKKERLDKFSIRKLTVGAASVLIGVAFGATTVSAAAKPAHNKVHLQVNKLQKLLHLRTLSSLSRWVISQLLLSQ